MSVSRVWSVAVDCKLSTASCVSFPIVLEINEKKENFYDLHYSYYLLFKDSCVETFPLTLHVLIQGLNKVYESSASTFAINDQLEGLK